MRQSSPDGEADIGEWAYVIDDSRSLLIGRAENSVPLQWQTNKFSSGSYWSIYTVISQCVYRASRVYILSMPARGSLDDFRANAAFPDRSGSYRRSIIDRLGAGLTVPRCLTNHYRRQCKRWLRSQRLWSRRRQRLGNWASTRVECSVDMSSV